MVLKAPFVPRLATGTVQPGDWCVVPVSHITGPLIQVASWLADVVDDTKGNPWQAYDHAEVYVGEPDPSAPHGYTCSAYPDRVGLKALDCPPEQIPGSIWSSGVFPLTDAQRAGIVQWCYEHSRVMYSALDYLAMTAYDLHWTATANALKAKVIARGSYICSYFSCQAWLDNGVAPLFDRWPGFVKPLDMAQLVESRRS